LINDRRLGVADAALLGRQLASVLGYLHRQGWVHLDVKPDNVVVQEGRAVLIDLGLATRPGRIERGMGTDGYAAPEQDAGGTVSPATDVWGLAATLVECVTGAAPGRQPDLARVPASLRPLLAACLRPDPADRPSVEQLGHRLDELLAEPPRRFRWTSRQRRRAG
jgi:serine/threonine protein kinase